MFVRNASVLVSVAKTSTTVNDNDDAGWDERGSDVGRPASDQMRARGDDGG
ncbi:hypothetical protein [Streptomyces phaeoluteigriseus]|uniref:hypothetical protein n=1 Tax=Streptomyces phaeoluteigriseus TaxID=114686 RepID=UPI001301F6FC|nr:hypothetical protein [Streptomyces phaeoluteigriseus]